jgi:uncharacterized protein (DUF608 family)
MDRRSFVRDSLISVAGLSKLLADPVAHASTPSATPSAAEGSSEPVVPSLFPTNLPDSQWVQFPAAGFSRPVTGVIYRKAQPATNGMPLGGIDTGCIDLETSGLFGYCTIFNSHVPRRGPLNLPFLGLSVGGQTWVMCDPAQIKQYQTTDGGVPVESYNTELLFDNLRVPKEIHYWGHYPVADMEFETDAPIRTSVRAWSPFLPGDVDASALPGMVFEVHLQNASASPQHGTVAFSFPGPSHKEAGADHYSRRPVHGTAERLTGVEVRGGWTSTPMMAPRASYVLGVVDDDKVRLGGELGKSGEAWANIAQQLPEATANHGGASAAVDFELAAGEARTIRFLVAWHSPQWKGGGNPSSDRGDTFTHMYALKYRSAVAAALVLALEHTSLLRRILAWQEVIYSDATLPGWLQDALINNLHLITETGMWAAAEAPLPNWVRPEDGLFGMNECPRGCPQIECIPCSFYGNIPVVYFFPQLALSTLRGYKGYMYPEGAVPWIFGGATGGTPPLNMNTPTRGYQLSLNGLCYADMVDRYALCWGRDKQFAEEFYESVKRNTIFTINLRPEYAIGERVISMPTGNEGTEWFEADKPGWSGMVAHVGGLHLAELRIALKMAEQVGDADFARQCREWLEAGTQSLETRMWNGSYYLNFWEPETGTKSDLVFGYQLDGQWVADFHGLVAVFQRDRAKQTLDTIKRCNVALSKTGAANYAHADASPAPVGGYGTYSYFPPEVLMLAMTYMYAGQREFGLDLARRCWENITCTWRYTWDAPNIMRGDKDTGESVYGHDYYQDMMLWSLPAAMAGQPMDGVVKPGGLVDRVIKAAAAQRT